MNKKSITITWESPTSVEHLDAEFAEELRSGLATIIKDLVDENVQEISVSFSSASFYIPMR